MKKLGPSTSKGIVEAWTALQGNVCRGISLPKEPVPPKWSQLGRLAGLAAVPMVGFGFADNFVMLLAGKTFELHKIVGIIACVLTGSPSFSFSTGDYIDATLCYRLNLSTLFAAGLGNVISDVAGLATAGPIETAARKMGIKVRLFHSPLAKTFFLHVPCLVLGTRPYAATNGHGDCDVCQVSWLGIRSNNRYVVRRWTLVSIVCFLFSHCSASVGCIIGMFPLLWPKEKRFWPSREDLEEEEEIKDHKDNK